MGLTLQPTGQGRTVFSAKYEILAYDKPMSMEVYPVVHVQTVEQAVEQSQLALELGANGIYLINHGSQSPVETLLEAYNEVTQQLPNSFVGINILHHETAFETFASIASLHKVGAITRLPDAIWTDTADKQKQELVQLRESHPELAAIRYLGGVAFKYTERYTDDPVRAGLEVQRLSSYVDVVTTSGAGTGKAPSPEKIAVMKEVAGSKPLAVASGISVENIADYTGLIDQLLVSSSVETRPYSGIFNPKSLEALVKEAKEQ